MAPRGTPEHAAPPPPSDAGELVFNPRIRLTSVRRGGSLVAVEVASPARDRQLRYGAVWSDEDPACFAILARLASGRGVEEDLDEGAWARLAELGVLVPARSIPRPVRFRCSPLDPPRARSTARRERLRVSPTLRRGRSPAALLAGPAALAPFAPAPAWMRVDHPDVPLPSLFGLDDAERALLRGLSPGAAPPASLDARRIDALAAAGVLVDPAAIEGRARAHAAALSAASAELAQRRYVNLRGVVHPAMLAALRAYYRDLVGEGYLPFGDGQVDHRYAAHNEPLARVIHAELGPLVSALAGEPYRPSYVYFSSYRGGATLAPHKDRAPCVLSISLLIDYEPEPRGPAPWPLWVGPPKRAVGVEQRVGDGLVYYGRELTHFRERLPEGHASTSLFLHYVPQGYTGGLS